MKHTLTAAVLVASIGVTPALARDFIYTSHSPADANDHVAMQKFFDRVTPAMPDGTNFRIMSGGAVASAGNAVGAVSSGSADSGVLIYAYSPSEIPTIAMIGDMPGPETMVSSAATTATMLLDCPQCSEEMDKVGINFLTNMATDTYDVICRDKVVTTIEDLQKIKTRGSGSIGRFIQHVNGTAVNIPYNEVYEAMQRGQVDCALLGASVFAQIKLWDVANTVTELSLGTYNAYGLLSVNMDVWDGMSTDARRAWVDNIPQLMSDHSAGVLAIRNNAVETAIAEHGLEVHQASDELVAAAREFNGTQIELAIATATERGVKDPEAIAAAYQANFDRWSEIIAGIGEQPWSEEQWGQYTKALSDNIYSKIEVK